MQLIQRSSGKQFDLPEQIKLSVELQNPYFSRSGSYTLPLSLPDTYNNRSLLGYANRLDVATQDSSGKWSRKINISHQVILSQGSWQQIGTLVLLSYSQSGFECSILLGESTIWEKLKDLTLKDVMKGIVWHPQTGRTTVNKVPISAYSISAIVNALEQRIGGTADTDYDNEDFAVFPVFVDGKGIINDVVYTLDTYEAMFHNQNIFYINNRFVLFDRSSGIGFTAFLHLRTVLELIFRYIGRELTIQYPGTIDGVDFESAFKKIVILNSTIDACAPGLLYYSTLVPDMQVLDFIQNMFAMFSAGFFETSETEVKMCFMTDTINTYIPNTIDTVISNIDYADDTYLQLAFNHLRGDNDNEVTDISTLDTAYIIPDEIKSDKDPNQAANNIHDQTLRARQDAQDNELVRLHDRGQLSYVTDAPGISYKFYGIACYDQLNMVAPAGTQTENIDNTITDTRLADVFDYLGQNDIYYAGQDKDIHFLFAYDIYTPLLAELNSETTVLRVSATTKDDNGNITTTKTEIQQLKGQPLIFCYHGGIKQFYNYIKGATPQDSVIISSYGTPYYVFDTDLAEHTALDLTTQGMPATMHGAYQHALNEGMHTVTCRAQMTMKQVFELDFSKPVIVHTRKYIIQTIRLTVVDKPLQEIELTLKTV